MSKAYQEVKRQIVTLELAPGTPLDDDSLSRQMQISRTPLREALFRLASEGFVEIDKVAGFSVRGLALQDIKDLFETHVVVARAVAHLAAVRTTDAELERIQRLVDEVDEAIKRQDPLTVTTVNALLHSEEARATHNAHLAMIAAGIHEHGQRLAYLCFGGLKGGGLHEENATLVHHYNRVSRHHHDMLRALKKHDPERAVTTAVAHVRLFRERVQRYLESPDADTLPMSESDWEAATIA